MKWKDENGAWRDLKWGMCTLYDFMNKWKGGQEEQIYSLCIIVCDYINVQGSWQGREIENRWLG